MFLFGKSHKSPLEIVNHLKEALTVLGKTGSKREEKALDDVSKWLQAYRWVLFGRDGQSPAASQVNALVQETHFSNVLLLMVRNLVRLDFEAKKHVTTVFSKLLRHQVHGRYLTVEYLCARWDILLALVEGYGTCEIALTCGSILRGCFRYEELARVVLNNSILYSFFSYVEASSFDIASDAFATFKDLLTRHRSLCAKFFETNYEQFFKNYQKLLLSKNYVTRRQSLKLLGELLLARQNFAVMTRYISDAENLKLIMNMLIEKSRSIQFEAFHVFKIFVANPNKTRSITRILIRNQEKLVLFLSVFLSEREDDEEFLDEKVYLIKQIKELDSQKCPAEVVHHLKDALLVLENKESKKGDKLLEEIGRWLQIYEGILVGSGEDQEINPVAELSQEAYNSNVLVLLVNHLEKLDFESKKRVAAIFSHMLRRQIGQRHPTAEYLCARYDVLFNLLRGCGRSAIALTCGMILRSCIRHEDLAKIVLSSPMHVYCFKLLNHRPAVLTIQISIKKLVSSFDIASDAFSTLRDLLTRHRCMCATFLDQNYKEFFCNYNKLLCSENYVTRRQSLKLLGEILLDRQNFDVMMRYINEAENLKLIMNLLREKSRSIQFEAFHVFKVFVANPKKERIIAEILYINKDKLSRFFNRFQNDRTDDQQFVEEKAFLIQQINDMERIDATHSDSC
uniref:Non-specific serine/threonine protein kinase n=1 Tax=Syphacia muris TaxID=451379 RepID=A0A158R4K9_9BILA